MSDGKLKETEERKRTLNFPVALEIILIFLLLMFLGGFVMYQAMEEEFLSYELGMYQISMEQILDVETQRFLEMSEDAGKNGTVNLEKNEENHNQARNDRTIEFTGELAFGLSDWESTSRRANIFMRYVFMNQDRTITALNSGTGLTEEIDPESDFAEAVRYTLLERKEVEADLDYGGFNLYMRLHPMHISPRVQYGDAVISKGGKDTSVVICSYYDPDHVAEASHRRKMTVMFLTCSGLVLVSIAVCIMIYRSLRVFRPMRASMDAIRKGEEEKAEEEGEKVRKLAATPEIMDLQESFQLMFLSSREYQANVTSITKMYDPLLPGALVDLFGKKDIRELAPGDQAALRGSMFLMGTEMEARSDVPFREMNRVYSDAANAAALRGGIVIAMGSRHITVYFPDTDQAVSSGDVIDMIRGLDLKGTGVKRIRMSWDRGDFTLSVIGVPERMTIRMDQESYGKLSEMDHLQEQHSLGPLYTEKAAEGLEQCRELWKLSGGGSFYELLTGEERSAAEKKRTGTLWKNAMDLYHQEHYRDAAQAFGALLRANPEDRAAAYLFEQCEQLHTSSVEKE